MHLKVRIASVVAASVALGQSSLLQSSVKKHSKVLVVLDRASELSTFDAEVSDEEVGEKMTHMFI